MIFKYESVSEDVSEGKTCKIVFLGIISGLQAECTEKTGVRFKFCLICCYCSNFLDLLL